MLSLSEEEASDNPYDKTTQMGLPSDSGTEGSNRLSAFLSAARSITLLLQKEGKNQEGFEEWYERIRGKLMRDKLSKLFKDYRDTSLHAQYIRPTIIYSKEARYDTKTKSFRTGKAMVGFEFEGERFTNGFGLCQSYLQQLKSTVDEAKEIGYLKTDASKQPNVSFEIVGLPNQ